MSASERLRELDEKEWTWTSHETGIEYVAVPRDALPLIADCIEAAEMCRFWRIIRPEDVEKLDVALSALREHLKASVAA